MRQRCIETPLTKTCFRLGRRFTFLITVQRQHRSGFGTSLKVLEWPSQSPDFNPSENLWRDLKIAVQQHYPSNLTGLERICRDEWEKFPKYKLGASYPRRLEAVVAAKGALTKY